MEFSIKAQTFLVLVVALAVTGCDTRRVVSIAPGEYELTYGEPLGRRVAANSILDWEALKVCPAGYTVVADEVRPGSSHPLYYWRIRCLGVADSGAD